MSYYNTGKGISNHWLLKPTPGPVACFADEFNYTDGALPNPPWIPWIISAGFVVDTSRLRVTAGSGGIYQSQCAASHDWIIEMEYDGRVDLGVGASRPSFGPMKRIGTDRRYAYGIMAASTLGLSRHRIIRNKVNNPGSEDVVLATAGGSAPVQGDIIRTSFIGSAGGTTTITTEINGVVVITVSDSTAGYQSAGFAGCGILASASAGGVQGDRQFWNTYQAFD